ncbi:hypothetical protein TB2_047247 [Malus domestica]
MAEAISAKEATVNLSLLDRGTLIPFGYQTVWADVSPLLDAACKDLQDGMLINGDNFNLFAAMSALEIMDPKMDFVGPSEEAWPPCEGGQDPQPRADLSPLPPHQGAPDHRHSRHPRQFEG